MRAGDGVAGGCGVALVEPDPPAAAVGHDLDAVAVAEFMVGVTGIGRKIADAKYFLDTKNVFAYTIVLVFLGLASEIIFNAVSKKVFNYVS